MLHDCWQLSERPQNCKDFHFCLFLSYRTYDIIYILKAYNITYILKAMHIMISDKQTQTFGVRKPFEPEDPRHLQ